MKVRWGNHQIIHSNTMYMKPMYIKQQHFKLKVSVRISINLPQSLMASRGQTTYRTAELILPEDETRGFPGTHGDIGAISKPPGINTLEKWGQVKAPSGKYPGLTFRGDLPTGSMLCATHVESPRGVVLGE